MGLYIISKDYSGYTEMSKFLRGHLSDWKNESMENCNYQCIFTGSKDYEIHHIISFNVIFSETMDIIKSQKMMLSDNIEDYNKDELDYILSIFKNVHKKYPLGVCVRPDIHYLFHRIYGSGGNNLIQWDEFTKNYKNGMYD